jgi:hypothetical protein
MTTVTDPRCPQLSWSRFKRRTPSMELSKISMALMKQPCIWENEDGIDATCIWENEAKDVVVVKQQCSCSFPAFVGICNGSELTTGQGLTCFVWNFSLSFSGAAPIIYLEPFRKCQVWVPRIIEKECRVGRLEVVSSASVRFKRRRWRRWSYLMFLWLTLVAGGSWLWCSVLCQQRWWWFHCRTEE